MKLAYSPIPDLHIIEIEPSEDQRGSFARIWSRSWLTGLGMSNEIEECSLSTNTRKYTLRGLHFQAAPYSETKIVRCVRGSIFDVAVDIRPSSPTYLASFSLELAPDKHLAFYIPPGFAHGFQTLEDNTDVEYFISTPYHAELARTIRWNDPALGIRWPFPNEAILSLKDARSDNAHTVLGLNT